MGRAARPASTFLPAWRWTRPASSTWPTPTTAPAPRRCERPGQQPGRERRRPCGWRGYGGALQQPQGRAAGADGRLWLADRGNRSLRWVAPLRLGHAATECLLDWGERSFPSLLAPPALSQTQAPYRYRAYAGGVYVGVSSSDRRVHLLQAGVLTALGGLYGFLQ